jgi:hypothetical protein
LLEDIFFYMACMWEEKGNVYIVEALPRVYEKRINGFSLAQLKFMHTSLLFFFIGY